MTTFIAIMFTVSSYQMHHHAGNGADTKNPDASLISAIPPAACRTFQLRMRNDAMLKRLGGFFYDTRRGTLVVAFALLVVTAIYGFGAFGTLKGQGFTVPSSPSSHADDFISARLSDSTTDIIALLHSDTLTVTDPA